MQLGRVGLYLLSEWFTHPTRHHELIWSVCANLANPKITEMILLLGKGEEAALIEALNSTCPDAHHRLRIIARTSSQDRMTVAEAMNLANQRLRPGSIVIIHNLDIVFSLGLGDLPQDPRLTQFAFFFLSRHELPSTRDPLLATQCDPQNYQGSHDALVFRTPFNHAHLLAYPLGQAGMEAKIIWLLLGLGYRGYNPCYRYRSWHVHAGTERNWALGGMVANQEGQSALLPPEP